MSISIEQCFGFGIVVNVIEGPEILLHFKILLDQILVEASSTNTGTILIQTKI